MQLFWEKGNAAKLPADHRNKIRLILDALNEAGTVPQDLLPFRNWKIHPLQGDYKGFWKRELENNFQIRWQECSRYRLY